MKLTLTALRKRLPPAWLMAALLPPLLTPGCGAQAQAEVQADPPPAIYVAGTRDPDWKSYRAFVEGMKVFEQQHQLAPAAPLRFMLRPRTTKATLAGVEMTIEGDGIRIPVPVAADGSFVLPRNDAVAEQGAEIMLTKRRNTLSWRPSVHSPGVPQDARRLGDLRLECAVRWAVEQADLLALFRSAINAFGGACSSAAVKVEYISDRPLRAVWLVAGERREMLPAKWIEEEGHVYLPPVHDTSWPDSTLLEFEYLPAAQAAAGL